MNALRLSCVTAAVIAAFTVMPSGMALAQSTTPSAKSAVLVGTAVAPTTCDVGWGTIFQVLMRNSGVQKDFILGLSGVTALITDTLVKSAGGTKDTSEAEAAVFVRVLVDGIEAAPGPIVFDRRKQTLMARFNGICTDLNGDGIVQYNECTEPEELQLILDTQAAHHFNFVSADVGTGIHTIQGQACTATAGSAQQGSFNASAAFGKGALTVEEVRLLRDAVVEQ